MDNELFTGVDRPAVLGTGLPQLLAVVKIVYENRVKECRMKRFSGLNMMKTHTTDSKKCSDFCKAPMLEKGL
jgi:hypothetical protein